MNTLWVYYKILMSCGLGKEDRGKENKGPGHFQVKKINLQLEYK